MINTKFGFWTVLQKDNSRKRYYICKCECGNIKSVEYAALKRNRSKSCGCKTSELKSQSQKIHGDSNNRFYKVWQSMFSRCKNDESYIEKGITINDDWFKYENFKRDMYESYLEHSFKFGEENTTLDRKDVFEDYNKDNCRWLTKQLQNQNTSNNPWFIAINLKDINYNQNKTIIELLQENNTCVKISKNKSEIARKYKLDSSCISNCLNPFAKRKIKQHNGWIFRLLNSEEIEILINLNIIRI